MFCPGVEGRCSKDGCLPFWSKEIQDCLRRLEILERINALSEADKANLTKLRLQKKGA